MVLEMLSSGLVEAKVLWRGPFAEGSELLGVPRTNHE